MYSCTHDKHAITLLTFAALALLAGCSTQVPYSAVSAPSDPKKFIEQVLAEQPQKYRPEWIRFEDDYVEYGDGTLTKSSSIGVGTRVTSGLAVGASSGSSRSRQNVVRLYFGSIVENRLLSKRRWWIVQSLNAQGRSLAMVWTDSEDIALKYIAALNTLSAKPAD